MSKVFFHKQKSPEPVYYVEKIDIGGYSDVVLFEFFRKTTYWFDRYGDSVTGGIDDDIVEDISFTVQHFLDETREYNIDYNNLSQRNKERIDKALDKFLLNNEPK